MTKVLVTGGCGFIGSNFIHRTLKDWDHVEIWNLDSLTYAANQNNLIGVDPKRYHFIRGSIDDCGIENSQVLYSALRNVDLVVNFAAESHVDRSIDSALSFVRTNVLGTNVLLSAALEVNPEVSFLQVGTDEVYGSVPSGVWADEKSILNPTNPYAASKAAADLVALSYHYTHGMNVMVARSTNNYGPRQHLEKMIPKFITNALADKPIPVYDDGSQIRDWLWVEDNCRALWDIVDAGTPGEIYNVGAKNDPEITNLELARKILHKLGKSEKLLEFKVGARPGHDQRYAVENAKMLEFGKQSNGWKPRVSLEEGLGRTIDWYTRNRF